MPVGWSKRACSGGIVSEGLTDIWAPVCSNLIELPAPVSCARARGEWRWAVLRGKGGLPHEHGCYSGSVSGARTNLEGRPVDERVDHSLHRLQSS